MEYTLLEIQLSSHVPFISGVGSARLLSCQRVTRGLFGAKRVKQKVCSPRWSVADPRVGVVLWLQWYALKLVSKKTSLAPADGNVPFICRKLAM